MLSVMESQGVNALKCWTSPWHCVNRERFDSWCSGLSEVFLSHALSRQVVESQPIRLGPALQGTRAKSEAQIQMSTPKIGPIAARPSSENLRLRYQRLGAPRDPPVTSRCHEITDLDDEVRFGEDGGTPEPSVSHCRMTHTWVLSADELTTHDSPITFFSM